jgi:hypothetical protein
MTKSVLAKTSRLKKNSGASGVARRESGPATGLGEAKVPWMLSRETVAASDVRTHGSEQEVLRGMIRATRRLPDLMR